MKTETSAVNINRSIGDFSYPEAHVRDAGAGLSERTVRSGRLPVLAERDDQTVIQESVDVALAGHG